MVGDRGRPARLRPPATLRHGCPNALFQVEEHEIIKTGACDLVVDVLRESVRVVALVQADIAQFVAECTVVFTAVDEQVLVLRDQKGLVIAPWHGSHSGFVANQIDLDLVCICN